MMIMLKRITSLFIVCLVAACGGSGDAGTSVFGGSGASGSGGTGGGSTGSYALSVSVQRAGVSTTQVSSTETVQALATVTDPAGAPVAGVVVTFAESQANLLKFAPIAATALTDASGKASVDLSAEAAANTGATTVNAGANVGGVSLTATTSIQVTAGTPNGGVAPTPAAINFVSSTPSGTAIVVKGAGGSGRSESAILTFRVVDASNAPINAATVTFAINASNGGASILPTTGTTNSDGLVTTTVASGTQPATIVVTATAGTGAAQVSTQSDSLIVSNSVPVAGGFEIVAAKYNLDGRKTGDSTSITAFVRDEFGNPVPDGVAVNFVTDFGAVASSTVGGCTTTNGTCSVTFRVQDPRGSGIATVTGSVRVGGTTELTQQIQINMAAASGSPYIALDPTTSLPLTTLTMSSCKPTFAALLSDGSGHSTAEGTTITQGLSSTGVTVALKAGTPVLDQLAAGFPPTQFGFQLDLSSVDLIPACNNAGVVGPTTPATFFQLDFKSPNGLVYSQRVELSYPH